MRFKPPHCKHLQGAAEARRRVCRRPFVLQVPDNKTDAVPCERLSIFNCFYSLNGDAEFYTEPLGVTATVRRRVAFKKSSILSLNLYKILLPITDATISAVNSALSFL